MPVDYKRINGPEITIPYQLYDKLYTKSLKSQFNELVNLNGTRLDSRQLIEHRKIFLKCGVVSQAKGSAYIEVNNTKVVVSVFDPREIPNKTDYSLKGEIYCEFKFAPFSCPKRRLHQQDANEKLYSATMKQALESAVCRHEFPNFQVDIYAMVLHNDGSALSAGIIAAGLALAHAGIPMYDMITSVTMGVQGNIKLLDPTLKEEMLCEMPIDGDSHGIVILSMLNTHEQISQFHQTGNLIYDELKDIIEILIKSNKEIVALVEKTLVSHVFALTKNIREV